MPPYTLATNSGLKALLPCQGVQRAARNFRRPAGCDPGNTYGRCDTMRPGDCCPLDTCINGACLPNAPLTVQRDPGAALMATSDSCCMHAAPLALWMEGMYMVHDELARGSHVRVEASFAHAGVCIRPDEGCALNSQCCGILACISGVCRPPGSAPPARCSRPIPAQDIRVRLRCKALRLLAHARWPHLHGGNSTAAERSR